MQQGILSMYVGGAIDAVEPECSADCELCDCFTGGSGCDCDDGGECMCDSD